MKKTHKLFLALAVASFGAVANALVPQKVAAEGSWEFVCCGALCPLGDECVGSGSYKCCKGTEE